VPAHGAHPRLAFFRATHVEDRPAEEAMVAATTPTHPEGGAAPPPHQAMGGTVGQATGTATGGQVEPPPPHHEGATHQGGDGMGPRHAAVVEGSVSRDKPRHTNGSVRARR